MKDALMSQASLPGATIGMLGGGDLGRMAAIAARRLGYRIAIYTPEGGSPAGQVADVEFTAEFDDESTLDRFADEVDVVTLEFENVPAETVARIERRTPVRPGMDALATAQNRLREKSRLRKIGLPTAPFRLVRTASEVERAVREFGGRGILKSTTCGYDGKGQYRIDRAEEAPHVWKEFNGSEAVLEGIVEFVHEFSVIGVRGVDGDIRCYDPIVNHHRNHILDVSVAPGEDICPEVRAAAVEMTRSVLRGLDVVGVLCVEFFHTESGDPIVNEIAPRPHNSGHVTIDAHQTCQFEQQIRAVCGLPLGSTEQRQPAAMANLLGDLWDIGEGLDWRKLLDWPTAKLHLYGKCEPRKGRKMGHVTLLSSKAATAEQLVREARHDLIVAAPDSAVAPCGSRPCG